ncbi:hypothetical protein GCM10023144_44220 [Pigmentiphaga soli]|uniref:Flagellar protein n=1 Tax=Pigmentiphaga soli TaxID=1007095 RepID=A0ABP8HPL7_9BURK
MAPTASYLQTVLALAAVLALIGVLAWLARRMRLPHAGGASPLALRGQLMVGPRERVVLVEVGEHWIVAGVAQGSVQPLAVLPRQEQPVAPAPAGNAMDFGTLLARLRPGGANDNAPR